MTGHPDGSEQPETPTTDLPSDARLAVLGDPIAHSKSPAIHLAAYLRLGLSWGYGAERIGVAELEPFLTSRGPEWRGFSLTMPLKEEARRIARVVDPVAEESGVVNTLLRLAGGAGWAGFNTDVGGLAQAIRGAGLDATRTIVIGSGATAVSAILAARRLGARRLELIARNEVAVAELVTRFDGTRSRPDAEPMRVGGARLDEADRLPLLRAGRDVADQEDATLVISTLPGAAAAQVVEDGDIVHALSGIPLFDVAYDPWPSPLGAAWRAAGGIAAPGTEMLVEQAILQIRIFTDGDPERPLAEEDAVRAAMRAAL